MFFILAKLGGSKEVMESGKYYNIHCTYLVVNSLFRSIG